MHFVWIHSIYSAAASVPSDFQWVLQAVGFNRREPEPPEEIRQGVTMEATAKTGCYRDNNRTVGVLPLQYDNSQCYHDKNGPVSVLPWQHVLCSQVECNSRLNPTKTTLLKVGFCLSVIHSVTLSYHSVCLSVCHPVCPLSILSVI
jgi:hypothetical protein